MTAAAVRSRRGEAGTRSAVALEAVLGGPPTQAIDGERAWEPPASRTAVRRLRLVARLTEAGPGQIVVLRAPAGFGKTTLLSQWAADDPRPVAWLTLDERDNDPRRLGSAVARAVGHVRATAARGRRVLVLDGVECLHRRPALAVVAALARDPGAGMTLALASRTEPPIPLARLRAEGVLMELGPRELAMSRRESALLLKLAGTNLDGAVAEQLVQRTEGWPVGLALATVAVNAERHDIAAAERFSGGDSLVADYVRDEILSDLSGEELRFVKCTSVLDTLTGPACDALLQRRGSARVLAGLARRNVLLVPLDRREERYRYQRLFTEAVRAELHRAEPDLESELHRRASEWSRQRGEGDRAVQHALAAGDLTRSARLIAAMAPSAIAQGRADSVDAWLDGFSHARVVASPPLALAAGLRELARGQGDVVEYWLAAAEGAASARPTSAVAAGIAVVRAAIGHGGIARMREDAARAGELAPDDLACRSLASFVAGTALLLRGDCDAAWRELEQSVRRAAVATPLLHALGLTQLAVIALDRDDWEEASGLIVRARSQIDRYALAGQPAAALVFAASALVRAKRARVDEAQRDVRQAVSLQRTLADYAPWYEVELCILLARSAMRLCNGGDAGAQLRKAARLLRRDPDAAVLRRWLAEAQSQQQAFVRSGGATALALTSAELRILLFLPTHLSFREIAERTFVSANTVKTQANAVYRKLDVSCRSGAVDRARSLGLLEG